MKKKLLSILLAIFIVCSNINFFASADINSSDDLWYYTENKDGTLTITRYRGKESNVVVPSQIDGKDVTIIGVDAFYGRENINQLKLPNTLKRIESGAFLKTSLEYVEIPESVEFLGDVSFANCENLKTVVLLCSNLYLAVGCYPLDLMPFAHDNNLTIYYPKDSMTEQQILLYDWSFGKDCNFIVMNDLDGDMNCDDTLTYMDLLLLKRYILGNSYLKVNADINRDGYINVLDVLELKNLIEID